ncbi:MAG: acylphosphatase [Anaerolineae bacterium]|jgi:acylphosphatase
MSQAPKEEAQLRAVVEGRVQGVNFRYYTVRTARRLGLSGWVANRLDGKVETIAEGPKPKLEEFLAYLHEGPPAALVTRVQSEWKPAAGQFDSFRVRYL